MIINANCVDLFIQAAHDVLSTQQLIIMGSKLIAIYVILVPMNSL